MFLSDPVGNDADMAESKKTESAHSPQAARWLTQLFV